MIQEQWNQQIGEKHKDFFMNHAYKQIDPQSMLNILSGN